MALQSEYDKSAIGVRTGPQKSCAALRTAALAGPKRATEPCRTPRPQPPERHSPTEPLRAHSTAVRESKVTVKIPRPLYRKIQQVVDGSGFNSPTDFIVFVLRDLMGDTPATKVEPEVSAQEGADFTQEELDDVRRKLENLGYL